MDEDVGDCHHQRPGQSGIADARDLGKADALPHPAVPLGAVVVADNRLGAVGDAHQGGGHHLPHRVDDRHHTDVDIAAHGLQRGVAQGLYQRVGHSHDETGEAQGQNLPHPAPLKAQSGAPQPQQGLGAGKESQHPHRRAPLGNDSGDGRPTDAHLEQEDKDGV